MAKNSSEDAVSELLDAPDWVETFVNQRPITAVAIAVVAGALAARWMFSSTSAHTEDTAQQDSELHPWLGNYRT